MAKTFRLINHKSLGPGILLSKEDEGVYKVAFAGKYGIKSILLNHPFVEDYSFSVLGFIKSELFEYIFDDFTKEKADSYINDKYIQIIDIGDDIINARVLGTTLYNVSISIRNSKITFTCDCPVSGLCKHMYAVCAYIYKNRFYQARRESDKKVVEKKDNAFFNMLSSYFYFPKSTFDFASFYKIYDYITANINSIDSLLNDIYKFYSRNQYQLRVLELLLFPLSLDAKIHSSLHGIYKQGSGEDINNMLSDLFFFEESASFKRIIETPWYKLAINYLKATLNDDLDYYSSIEIRYGFESEYYLLNMVRFISNRHFSLIEIYKLSASIQFRNYMYILRSRINETEMNKDNVKYLFIPIMKEDEIRNIDIPIELLFSYISSDEDNKKYISTLVDRFNEIPSDKYQLIAECICQYISLPFTEKMRYEEEYLSLAEKLPDNAYLSELIKAQRKKRRRF